MPEGGKLGLLQKFLHYLKEKWNSLISLTKKSVGLTYKSGSERPASWCSRHWHPVAECPSAVPWSSFLGMCLGEQQQIAQVLAPDIHEGDLDGIPDSRVQPGPAQAVVDIYRANSAWKIFISLKSKCICIYKKHQRVKKTKT